MDLELKEYMFTFEGGGWNTVWQNPTRKQELGSTTI